MGTKLTRADLIDWIDLLYTDLNKDTLYIGGYYFTFGALPEFVMLKDELNTYTKSLDKQIDILEKQGHTKTSNLQLKNLYEDKDAIRIELGCKNNMGQTVRVPCTPEEFNVVFNTLLEFKKDVEYFKTYCVEEANKIKQEDIPQYMWFLNDMIEDLRGRFKGNISN